jgi:hypothetical protein
MAYLYIPGFAFLTFGAALLYFHIEEGGERSDRTRFFMGVIFLILGFILTFERCSRYL